MTHFKVKTNIVVWYSSVHDILRIRVQ